eukprot:TRINITY_DN4158_c0_g1_i1.p1 TRINITY_DN4158_c0_g1~~TRINITY_DN4158_c0_g1_i1.p1  ORF type:complete len:530 (-),score=114.34 TRINITY_DN4158_c0_g1_i1:46-1527(-)
MSPLSKRYESTTEMIHAIVRAPSSSAPVGLRGDDDDDDDDKDDGAQSGPGLRFRGGVLSANMRFQKHELQRLVECIWKLPQSSLYQLEFNSCKLGPDGISTIVSEIVIPKGDSELSCFRIEEEDLQSAGCDVLARVCGLNLSFLCTLEIKRCKFDEQSFNRLLSAFRLNQTISSLVLQENALGSLQDGKLLASLVNAVKSSRSLTHLDLEDNEIKDAGSAHLAELLETNKTLQILLIAYNGIKDEGTSYIAQGLSRNNCLEVLDLGGNGITAVGAATLAGSLENNSSLTELKMDGNKLEDAGTEVLCAALQGNSSIVSLSLVGNRMTVKGAEAVADLISVTKSLSTLRLGGKTTMGDEGARMISHALARNTTLTWIVMLLLFDKKIEEEIEKKIGENLKYNLLWKKQTLIRFLKQKNPGCFDIALVKIMFQFAFPGAQGGFNSRSELFGIPHDVHSGTSRRFGRKRSAQMEREVKFAQSPLALNMSDSSGSNK